MPISFKGYRSVTQGYPLSPTIFNMLVDSVIRHWVMVVAPTEAGAEGLDAPVQDLADYLCVDNGLVMYPRKDIFQRVFDVLADLFDQVSLRKNARNKVIMVCQPQQTPISMMEAAYEIHTTWVGP